MSACWALPDKYESVLDSFGIFEDAPGVCWACVGRLRIVMAVIGVRRAHTIAYGCGWYAVCIYQGS